MIKSFKLRQIYIPVFVFFWFLSINSLFIRMVPTTNRTFTNILTIPIFLLNLLFQNVHSLTFRNDCTWSVKKYPIAGILSSTIIYLSFYAGQSITTRLHQPVLKAPLTCSYCLACYLSGSNDVFISHS